jgi:hypothetical protein
MNNQDITNVVEYTLYNERTNYEEWVESGGEPDQHIYTAAKRLEGSVATLTKDECANLLDALNEWCEVIGPKELEGNEEGLDAARYNAIVMKLRNAQEGDTYE